jgi:hypothetical protein
MRERGLKTSLTENLHLMLQRIVMGLFNERARQTGADTLMSDADLASTFLDLAETTVVEENRIRRRAQARRAYHAILKFVSKSNLTQEQRSALAKRLDRIRGRLWVGAEAGD